MFRIGYRTIKTAIGVAISITVAQLLNLEFFVSAGIITVLCIQKTKRKSLQISWARFAACVLGLIFGIILFEVIGYQPLTIALILMLFIPTTVIFKIQEGIVTSCVIMLHLYSYGQVTVSFIINELILIVIGIGCALVLNIYIPSVENKLQQHKHQLERLYSKILHELAIYVKYGDYQWDGKEITEAADLLYRAKNTALQNLENQLLRYEDQYYHYFKMREKQLEIIERIVPLLTTIDVQLEQGQMIGNYLQELSEGVNPNNTAIIFIDKLEDLRQSFKEMPLPTSREEFEARSSLFHLLHEIEQYLTIKQQFKPIKNYSFFR